MRLGRWSSQYRKCSLLACMDEGRRHSTVCTPSHGAYSTLVPAHTLRCNLYCLFYVIRSWYSRTLPLALLCLMVSYLMPLRSVQSQRQGWHSMYRSESDYKWCDTSPLTFWGVGLLLHKLSIFTCTYSNSHIGCQLLDDDNHTSDTSNRRLPRRLPMRKYKLSLSESSVGARYSD